MDFAQIAMTNKGIPDEIHCFLADYWRRVHCIFFCERYVRGTADIDYDQIVGAIGLSVKTTRPNANRSYIGADLAEDGGRLTIRSIPAGTPAYDQGLNTGDQIIAVDGYRATQNFLTAYVGEKKAGDRIRLSIFRFDKLREVDFTLGANLLTDYDLVPVAAPTDDQKKLYHAYLNADL